MSYVFWTLLQVLFLFISGGCITFLHFVDNVRIFIALLFVVRIWLMDLDLFTQ